MIPRSLVPLHVVALVACAAAAMFVIVPFWPWLVLALWAAGLAQGLLAPMMRLVRGQRRAAALITLAILVAVVLPFAIALVPLTLDAVALIRRMARAGDVRKMLELLVSPGGPHEGGNEFDLPSLSLFATAHGTEAWQLFRRVAGATTHALFGVVVFVVVAYGRLVRGAEAYAWIESHTPIDRRYLARIAAAFSETGRGLLIGIGGAALAQATIATATYAAVGVPHAFGLGLLTLLAALIPGIGTGLVWVPVAAGLALTGRPGAAVIVLLIGVSIIGTIDNVLKPVLARHGRLDLPMSVVFLSMFGGFTLIGPTGLLLGPLVVRLTKEVIVIAKEEREREVHDREVHVERAVTKKAS